MNWKVLLAVSAVGGGIVWSRRRLRQEAADSKLWSEATDPVARFGPGGVPPVV